LQRVSRQRFAAEGAHVSQVHGRDLRRRLPKAGVFFAHGAIGDDLVQ